MPNLTHSFEPPLAAVPNHPPHPVGASYGLGQVFELLMIPFIVVGYHVAVTFLKLIGHREE
jgi:hypothetical protein